MGKVKEIKSGGTILAAANRSEVPLGQSCGGEGICGWCRVRILDGVDHLSRPTALERKLMVDHAFASDERAACLAGVHGDISVTASYW
jgi:ferredoxin